MELTGGTQVRVPATREKFHCLMYKEILVGYDDFITYFVVESLRATTNFGCLGVLRCMTLKYIRVVGRLYHSNNNTTVLSTLFVPYLHES